MPRPHARKLPRWRRRRTSERVWSIKTITIVAVVVIAITAATVFALGKRSLFDRTELTLLIIAAALFVFLAVGLYRGIRVRRIDIPGTEVSNVSAEKVLDGMDPMNAGAEFAGAADDPISAAVGCVVGIVVMLLLGVLLWVLLSFGMVLWVFLLAALSWVFYRALRIVFAKSRVCRGKLGASLYYAFFYTVLYTGWLFALVLLAEWLVGTRLRGG